MELEEAAAVVAAAGKSFLNYKFSKTPSPTLIYQSEAGDVLEVFLLILNGSPTCSELVESR